ncbi:MAG: serine/threonine-protein kinase [Gemmatirosa sp.]
MASLELGHTFVQEFAALGDALRGQFRVERELGRGGMGVVYLARDERLDRMVALKVLPAALAAEPQTRERFLREARTAARLAHPNIVPVYRADEAGGSAYFAMAYVDGESLADRVRDRGPLPPVDAMPILRDVAWALAYAQARGGVHRDVKPENILLERATRRTLVTDFGIAHHTTTEPSARLTQDGHVLGTLHFMSPEQVNGDVLDGRSDLYALGVVAYHVLSGRLPFEGLAAAAVLVAHATKPAPPLRQVAPDVPRALAAVVDRCLAKAPGDRYPTGEALAEALERALTADLEASHGLPFAPGLPARIGELQAAAVWRRAAQLQADALRRQEMRGGAVERLSAGRGQTMRGADASADASEEGYRVADVATAAEEAGISRQYLALALAELPRGTLPTAAASGVSERNATLFLGTAERSLSVTHVVPASPARTLRALGAVLQQAPYELQLRETVGAHPLDGGVIVFAFTGAVVGVMNSSGGTSAGAVNAYWMQTQQALEARQLQVTLRAVPGEPQRTEVTVTCDLRPGVRPNVRVSQWLAGTVGSLTGFFTGAMLAKGAAVALSTAVLGPAAAVGLATVGVSLAAYRWAYPGIMDKARREIFGALEAVAAAVQSEDVFGTLPGPGRRQRLSEGDDGAAAALLTSI